LIESHIGLKVGFMWLGLNNLDELGRVLNSCPKCYTPRNIFRKMWGLSHTTAHDWTSSQKNLLSGK